MFSIITSLVISLLSSLNWPFSDASEYRIHRGYGDYNSYAGFHPGIDIAPPNPGSIIQNVYGNAYIFGSQQTPFKDEWSLLLSQNPPVSDMTAGVLYEHVYGDSSFFATGDSIGQNISFCAAPPSGQGARRHVHIAWFNLEDWQPGVIPQTGIADILQSFSSITDEVVFSPIRENQTGILFLPDVGYGTLEILRGAVDFAVSASSSLSGELEDDSCGVRSISVSIARQSPTSLDYMPTAYQERTVFDWNNMLVDCIVGGVPDEYNSLYGGHYPSLPFDINYILTNSGNQDPGMYGIGNIWTEPYSAESDYNEGKYSRGAWDTRRGLSYGSATPWLCQENVYSDCPDGRYLVNVTATSHAGNSDSISLPVDNVELADPTPIGIVVDNFIPHVQQVIFYTTYPDNEFHLLYHGKWISVSGTERTLQSKAAGYLPKEVDNQASGCLGMAIRFSEPMNPNELPAVWLEGTWANEVQWSSLDDRFHWFIPESFDPIIPSDFLAPTPEADISGHWVCYKTLSYSEPGYVGSLTINIGEASSPGTGLGLDLAGNYIDPDPSTITPPSLCKMDLCPALPQELITHIHGQVLQPMIEPLLVLSLVGMI